MVSRKEKELPISMFLSCIILLLVYGWTIYDGKTLIYLDIGADTYSQYWPQYAFLRNYLIEGEYTFWSFSQGLGSNVFSIIKNLFVPTFWLIYMFPAEKMYIGMLLATFIRSLVLQYFSYCYVREIGLKDWSRIIASLCITFSGYFIGWGQHFTFGVMFVDFIAILLAFESQLNTPKKWFYLVLPVAHLMVISFYFAYMVLLFLAIYASFRYFMRGGNLKGYFRYGFRLLMIGTV